MAQRDIIPAEGIQPLYGVGVLVVCNLSAHLIEVEQDGGVEGLDPRPSSTPKVVVKEAVQDSQVEVSNLCCVPGDKMAAGGPDQTGLKQLLGRRCPGRRHAPQDQEKQEKGKHCTESFH